jgi:GH18 family chitinase
MVLEKSKGTFDGDIVRIAIPADPKVIEHVNKLRPGFWQAIADAIDTLNAMTYDYNGPWGSAGTTGFNSPLSSDPDAPVNQRFLNIDNTIKALLACGVPPGKFGVGAALYARVYKLGRTSGTKPYQPWNGACSMFDDPNGVITNRSIYRGINQAKTAANNFNFLAGETAYPPAGPNYSMAWSQTEKDVQCLITWDNAASAARKMHHAADNGLASVIVWETSQDVRQNDYLVTGQPVDLAKHSVIYGLGHYKDYPK